MPRHADAKVAQPDSVAAGPAQPEADVPPDLGPAIHYEGKFPVGTIIHKGMGLNSYMMEVDTAAPDHNNQEYQALVAKYEQQLPPPESGFYANGLNRQQLALLMASQEFIGDRAGLPDEHTMERNLKLYSARPGAMPLSDILQEGRGALTCVEASAAAQQLLAGDLAVTYVSGSADLRGNGMGEPHSFNIVGLPDHPKYAAAVVDLANPEYGSMPDGKLAVSPYCEPITAQQLKAFDGGASLVLQSGSGHRIYQTAIFFNGAAPVA